MRVYLTLPARQRSCTTMSVPRGPLYGLVCVEKARRRRGRMEDIIWHTAPVYGLWSWK